MPALSACPQPAKLVHLLLGKLPEPEASLLVQHSSDCTKCDAVMQTLRADDTLVDAMRASGDTGQDDEKDLVDRLVRKVRDMWPRPSLPANAATLDVASASASGSASSDTEGMEFLSPPQQPDEIGRLGHYRILKVLGQGGMGMVFQAEDIHLERRVALKVMLPDIARRKESRDRFLREAKLAAAIEHDNIVPIFQVGQENGVPFLAMPWLKGMSLEDRLQKAGKLPIPQVLRLGRQIALGLAAAHDRGLIHRDIKPGNLWIEPEQGGRIKILDFGLARSVEKNDMHLTQSGAILGTPAYMAPEQAQGQKVDGRCDLFSLGVVLYRMATGYLPFQGDNTTSLLIALVMNDPTPPSAVNPGVPAVLSELIMQLLAKEPAQRPVTAKEVAGRLQQIEREYKVTAIPTEPEALARAQDNTLDSASGSIPVGPAAAAGTAAFAFSAINAPKPAQTQPASKKRRPALLTALAVGLLLVSGGAYALFQIAFNTPQGTFIVQIDSPDVEARFKNGELQLLGPDGKVKYTLKASDKNKQLAAGPYTIKVVGADGLCVDVGQFEMKDGDKRIVHVKLVPADNTKPDGKPISSPNASGYALHFKQKDRVEFPKLNEKAQDFTLEGWFMVEADKMTAPGNFIYMPAQVALGFHISKMSWRLSRYDAKGPISVEGHKALPAIWTHVATVCRGDQVTVFVNGKPEKRATVKEVPAIGGGKFQLSDANIVGTMREVRISKLARYDKDFTPAQRFEPDADTLALYHFDEGSGDVLKDSSGNGHHGKIVGAKWVKADGTPIMPAAQYALRFDSDGVVEISSKVSKKPESFTVEGWFLMDPKRPKSNDANRYLIDVAGPYLGVNYGPVDKYYFTKTDQVINLKSDGGANGNEWTHVAAVQHAEECSLFVNGKLAERKKNDAVLSGIRRLGDKNLRGSMKEIRVSKTARYDKDFAPANRFEPDADTLALYHFDEGQGDKLTDSSGNGHHGKIVGAKWVKADGSPIQSSPLALAFANPAGKWGVQINELRIAKDEPFTWEGYVTQTKESQTEMTPFFADSQINLKCGKRWILKIWNGPEVVGPEIVLNRPTHIAGVSTGKQIRLFVDGKLVKSADLGSLANAWKAPTGLGWGFTGILSEVRFSKVARYDKDFTPAKRFEPDKDTIALYHFDEGAGDVLKDSSGNNHHGKIVGATWVNADGTPIEPALETASAFAVSSDGTGLVQLPSLKLDSAATFTLEGYLTAKDNTDIGTSRNILGAHEHSGLALRDGKLRAGVFTGNKWFNADSGQRVIPGKRIHVAAVLAGKELRVFLNGKLEQITKIEGPLVGMNKAIYGIGSTSSSFVGIINEVRISKVARYDKDFTPAKRFEPDKDTIALYHFDEGAGDVLKDSSGNGHHGKIVGAKWVKADGSPIAAPPPVLAKHALQFDGKSNYALVPSWNYSGNHPLTLEAWAVLQRPENDKDTDTLMSNALDSGFCISSDCNDTRTWGFCMHFGSYRHATAIQVMPRNRLVHIAAIYDGKAELRFFIDGKLQNRTAVKGKHRLSNGMPFTLGADPYPNSKFDDYLLGQLHEVRVSKVSRYDNDFTPQKRFEPDGDTIILYHFDEGAGDKLTDSSGNGHHGKIVGAKWVKADGSSPGTADPDRKAAEWALALGGSVKILLNGQEKVILKASELPAAPFNVTFIDLQHSKVSDDGLIQVKELPKLKTLMLSFTKVSDAGLVHLKDLTKLDYLNLTKTQVGDAGLVHLKGLTDLRGLDLPNTQVGDGGLVHLKDLSNLKTLILSGTQVTDVGMQTISTFAGKLVALHMHDTRVSKKQYFALKAAFPQANISWSEPNRTVAEAVLAAGGSVKILRKGQAIEQAITAESQLPAELFQVVRINLAGTTKPLNKVLYELAKLTDKEFDHLLFLDLSGTNAGANNVELSYLMKLANMPDLAQLSLAKTPLGDAFLPYLYSVKTLKQLDLTGTKATAPGVQILHAALPQCKIVSDHGTLEPKGK